MTFRINSQIGMNPLPSSSEPTEKSVKPAVQQDSKPPIPNSVTVLVNTKDEPIDIESRALYKAARQAGLPRSIAKEFAQSNADGNWSFTANDPSPENGSKAQKSDSALLKNLTYKLNKFQRTDLQTLQLTHELAGGKFGKELPSKRELAAQMRGIANNEAQTRRNIEAKLPKPASIDKANGSGPKSEVNTLTSTNKADNQSSSTTNVVDSYPNAPTSTKTISDYKEQAIKMIQKPNAVEVNSPEADVRERNRIITGAYADLYLKNPEAFSWLGAAAYASGQVGFALDEASKMKVMSAMTAGILFMEAGKEMEKNIREMLGKGNIAIFESIYPASLAYQQGGMAELKRLEASIEDKNEREKFSPLVSAYELIDKGVQMNRQQPNSGDLLIKEGTEAIIKFEQKDIAQSLFDEYAKTVRVITPFSFGDLDADDTKIDKQTYSSFPAYRPTTDKPISIAYTKNGYQEIGDFVSIGDVDARINWITNDIFPKWDEQRKQRFDETRANMQKMIEAGRKAGGQY